MSKREKYVERREVHQEIAKKLLKLYEEAEFTTVTGEVVKGTVRKLGGGEIMRAYQAEGVKFDDVSVEADLQKVTWEKMLVQHQLIARAFKASTGRTFTVEELDELIPFGESGKLANQILVLSGITKREAEVTAGPETGQSLETFRSEQVSK